MSKRTRTVERLFPGQLPSWAVEINQMRHVPLMSPWCPLDVPLLSFAPPHVLGAHVRRSKRNRLSTTAHKKIGVGVCLGRPRTCSRSASSSSCGQCNRKTPFCYSHSGQRVSQHDRRSAPLHPCARRDPKPGSSARTRVPARHGAARPLSKLPLPLPPMAVPTRFAVAGRRSRLSTCTCLCRATVVAQPQPNAATCRPNGWVS